jgi:phosphatidylserine/phosphatidylglycerophosphate/cardiolipin synthase-like enzyme
VSGSPRPSALVAALVLLAQPLTAQVRPIVLPPMTGSAAALAAPTISGPAALPAPAFLAGTASLTPALSALAAAPIAAAAPAAAVAAAPALAAVSAAAAPVEPGRAAAARAQAEAALPAAVSAAAPALAGFGEGRRAFDGAAAAGEPRPVAPVPPAPIPAQAPRGRAVAFNGVSLPTRMFSDQTQISGHLVRAIDATKKTLDIAIYELALSEVRDALARAKDRGVTVRIVMDEGHVYPQKGTRTPEVQSLIDAGFVIRTLRGGDAHGIMHNKFAVFDGALLETGSFNWTRAADQRHFENALFDDEARRIASYQNYWNWMWSIARPVDLRHPPAAAQLDAHGHTPPLAPAPQDSEEPISFNGASFPRESFTPRGTAAKIAAAIDASRESVDLANFSFTNSEIIDALKRAKDRGIKIRLIFDSEQFKFLRDMGEMATLGFDVRISGGRAPRGVMHNKFGVFDGRLVETGSFNWTMNGELNNYENAAFLDAPDDAEDYAAYFERIWGQARVPAAADFPPERPAADGAQDALAAYGAVDLLSEPERAP